MPIRFLAYIVFIGLFTAGYTYYAAPEIFGLEPRSNYQQFFKQVQKQAQNGDAMAQNHLGYMYDKGIYTEENDEEALKWYRKAADSGLAKAQYNVGIMYENGYGVAKDTKQAMYWYKKAAMNNSPHALYFLAGLYRRGIKVEKDFIAAGKLYHLAAENGSHNAINYLKENLDDCIDHTDFHFSSCSISAGAENPQAMHRLAIAYFNGKDIEKNPEQAMFWLEETAKKKIKTAQLQLAGARLTGMADMPADPNDAYIWFTVSATWPDLNTEQRQSLNKGKRLALEKINSADILTLQKKSKEYAEKYGY